jgi:serine O-acetyltransferase
MSEARMTAREHFRADLERYFAHFEKRPSLLRRIYYVTQAEGVWAVWWFRFGQYLRQEASLPVRLLFELPYRLAEKWIGHVVGIHLYPQTPVGPGLYIGHYGGIWIAPLVKIGANCSISQGVTIGRAGNRTRDRGPELGDRVWVGPNAVITGKVKIGNGAVIGANSLVASNIPENGVAIGVPARVIGYSGSGDLIALPKPNPSESIS